jgi:hypothetical protein
MSLEHRSGNPIRDISIDRQQRFAEWQRAMAGRFPGAEAVIREELNGFIQPAAGREIAVMQEHTNVGKVRIHLNMVYSAGVECAGRRMTPCTS